MEELRTSAAVDVPVSMVSVSTAPTMPSHVHALTIFDSAAAIGLLTREGTEVDEAFVFGSLVDAQVDTNGNVLLLDKDYGIIRVLTPALQPIQNLGRAGDGPGEFVRAEALIWISSEELAVFDAGGQRLEHFRRSGSIYEVAGRTSLVTALPRVEAACVTRERLFVMGMRLSVDDGLAVTPANVREIDFNSATVGTDGFLHELGPQRGLVSSFSMPYAEIKDPLLGIYLIQEGALACAGGRLWAGYGFLGEIHSFSDNGTLRWIARISDVDFPGYVFNVGPAGERMPGSGGLNVDATRGQFTAGWVSRLNLIAPDILAVDVATRNVGSRAEGYPERYTYRTYLLDATTGDALGAFAADHRILGGRDGSVVLYREAPHPQITLVRLEQ